MEVNTPTTSSTITEVITDIDNVDEHEVSEKKMHFPSLETSNA
jgi:hypothetical protein